MSICTKLSVRAFRDRMRPMSAETLSVVLRVILLLDGRMTICAAISRGAFLSFFYKWAHCPGIEISWSATILFVMVVDAKFVVMFQCDITRADFKDIEIQLLDLTKFYFNDNRRSESVAALTGMSVISKVLTLLTQFGIIDSVFISSHRLKFYNL